MDSISSGSQSLASAVASLGSSSSDKDGKSLLSEVKEEVSGNLEGRSAMLVVVGIQITEKVLRPLQFSQSLAMLHTKSCL